MPAPRTVLLTGAAGGLGTLMRGLLPAYGYELRLFDVTPIEGEPDAITADLGDKEALREAVRGVDAIIHLAGISLEASFDKILRSNIEGTYNLYEAAREEGVGRIVFASSNHAIGFTPRPAAGDALIPVDTPRRPDTFYGLSKSFGEDLAQFYWDKHGVETVSVRIGSCFTEPTSVRMLSVWMSPGDGARLFHAALTAPDVRHTVVYGSSDNTRLWWDLTTAKSLGYAPQDDSEQYADKLVAEHGELDPQNPEHAHIGGHFVTDPPIWPY
ncbi:MULTISPECIES: NAD-dependent epimerase/dehydratase family protein [Streptomyces]|uniref:Uronate dehydrogenase n=1 Tax=Streptomyces clavifer TaxID=68188 RepID=A0ABS4VDP2_9ACTN|nr:MULTISPECIES: NAD(P)-dependent oxidoreductase [Streptomyces]MBP2362046.1 uronate dehydrogenase [Streptomyces clavifer]MDX2746521.1 NAD(P)-dependent oxidoreductase [Streptomyces sp. NRRL_B-2557]MDX3065602.1 NAD(P)-dependent oxidoreductase [Streptomyces sp. ND04-05B]WRY81448.1 NAD(P)-dependent oxidoreductase [Streptomyces clavifer]GHB13878.1 NAD-dependent dehydratase [Streptomyces clavifer]